jgi:ParB family chromosome partitioning protein
MSKKNDFGTLDLITAFGDKKKTQSKLPISSISISPDNPRVFGKDNVEDLKDSLQRLGLIEPIVVRKEKNNFQIVAGERRFRAAKALGWEEIPAIITEADPDICYEMALAENEKRKNLNPWEVGKAIQYLRKSKNKSAEEVGLILGYTERYIKQLSSIARLDQRSVYELLTTGVPLTVKNLENALKKKEGRTGETISPRGEKETFKLTISLNGLNQKMRSQFLKELEDLKKKYGIGHSK